MSDASKLVMVAVLILIAGRIEYKSEVQQVEMQKANARLMAIERQAAYYLPPMDCSHCHNMRVGATRVSYK